MRHRLTPLVVVALLTACSTVQPSSDHTANVTVENPSPIAQFLGLGSVAFDEIDRVLLEDWAAGTAAQLRTCLGEQGFDFDPPTRPTDDEAADDSGRYGFGYTTRRFTTEAVGPGLVGYDTAPAVADPNGAYRAGLGPEDGARYDEAVSMCSATITAAEPGALGEFVTTFAVELERLDAAVYTDARSVAAETELEACVVAAGYTYTERAELASLWAEDLAAVEQHLSAQTGVLDDTGRALLSQAQAEEFELAAVYDTCGGFASVDAARLDVRNDLETRFLTDNTERLTPFEGAAG